MKISSTLLGLAGATTILGGLVAYRVAVPCSSCPITMGINAVFGGECADCATPKIDQATVVSVALDETKPATPTPPASEEKTTPAKLPGDSKDMPTSTPATPATTTPEATQPKPVKTESAMFGAGCFWGVEATFRKVPGVVDAAVGYSGGKTKNPTYKDVCTDTTGHAEVIKIEFDPAKVTYAKLVETFFKLHDPTQLNRQGPDYGSQYRSAIFFYSPEQEKAAREIKERLDKSGKYKRPIVTQVEKAAEFYRAEEYHQQYLFKRGMDSCHLPAEEEPATKDAKP